MRKMNYGFRKKEKGVLLMLCLAVQVVLQPSALNAKGKLSEYVHV